MDKAGKVVKIVRHTIRNRDRTTRRLTGLAEVTACTFLFPCDQAGGSVRER